MKQGTKASVRTVRQTKSEANFNSLAFLSNNPSLSSFLVIVLIDQVHTLEEFVQENERTDKDKGTEEVPSPESPGADVIWDISGSQFITHSVAYPVIPDKRDYAKRQPAENEEHETIMHRVLSITGRCDLIDFFGNMGHNDKSINTERNYGEKHELHHPTICT